MIKQNSTPNDLARIVSNKIKGAKISYPEPPEEVLNRLFETLFYASLKTEEAQYIKVTVTLIDPEKSKNLSTSRLIENSYDCIFFEEEVDLTVKDLVKLSKAADPWSSSLAVYYNSNNELKIWGMIDQALHYQSFLNYETEDEPEQPGLFQTTVSGIGCLDVIFDYELIATLKQNVLIDNYIDVFNYGEICNTILDNSQALENEIKDFINDSFPTEKSSNWVYEVQYYINASLSRILLRLQNYKHGGALLITDDYVKDLTIKHKISYNRLSNSIINLIKLDIENTISDTEIDTNYIKTKAETLPLNLYLDENVSGFKMTETRDELKGVIRFIASLSCIDGLVVISPDMKVKGFGAVISSIDCPPEIFISKNSTVNESRLIKSNSNHFGTRHRSMFSYCWNNQGSIGFVVSQDGDIRAIMRVNDKLIMWENIMVQQFIRSEKLKRFIIKRRLTQ